MKRVILGLSFVALIAAFLGACSANSGPGTVTTTSTNTVVAAKAEAPAVSFSISPHALDLGGSAIATWSTSGATACRAGGAWSGAMALSNSLGATVGPINASGTYTYSITCTGPGGVTAVDQTLTAGVVPAPVIQFQLTPAAIKPGNAATITWSTTNAASCTGIGGTGSDGWAGAHPIADVSGFSTGPIAASGQYPYDLSCTGPGGTAEASRILTVSTAAPAAPPTVSFAAQPTFIQPGQSTTLSWTTTNATSCTASGGDGSDGWKGNQPTASSGMSVGPLNTAGNFSYTLTCQGAGGSAGNSVTVLVSTSSVPPAVSVSIGVAPQQIVAGASAALTWATSNAQSCSASGSWSGTQPLMGTSVSTGTLMTPGVYSYTLNCTGFGAGAGGSATASLTVNPAPASISTFSATPTSIQTGQSVVLSWISSGATSCAASGGSGSDGWNGQVGIASAGTAVGPISPANSYTYTLTCTGPGGPGAPKSVVVAVSSPSTAATVLSFRAAPSTIQTGQSTVLSWTSSGATSCTATGGTGSDGWHGVQGLSSAGQSVGPINVAGNYTYTLTCTGPGGTGAPVSVGVDVNSAPPPASILTFTVAPGILQTGQTITLAWTTANATSCTAGDGTGSDGWSGTVAASSSGTSIGPISVVGTYNYALTCTGPGGTSAPASTSIIVSALAPPASILAFLATPPNVQTGQPVLLSWVSVAAASCTATGGTGTDAWHGSMPISSLGTSTGPLTSVGTFIYTLTCSGPGGASAPSSANVNVTAAPPPAGVISFTATPTTLETGQSTVLAWSSSGATSCTASGGTGSDGWNGSVGTSSTGTSVGPFNAAGVYVYSLTCTGAGGTGVPSSVSVTVSNAPTAAGIIAFTASPGTVRSGQNATLAWSTSGATSCTAGGGTGSDGWSGTEGTSSAATVVGPLTTVGTVVYTLTCTGPGGTSPTRTASVMVTAATPGQPTVTLSIDGNNPAQIQPGQAPILAWSSTNATSCSASGGTGSDGWSGAQATSATGHTLNAIGTPGIYSYTLTCTGPGGSGSSTVALTVISSSGAQCAIGQPSTLLLAPAASAASAVNGICLLGCGVANLDNVIDSSTTDFATLSVALGVAASVSLTVSDDSASFPAGREAGFLMAENDALLSASLLGNISVVTLLNGTVQEIATGGGVLQLQALGLLYDPDAAYVEFKTTKPFNSVRVVVGSLASVLSSVKVYGACVTLQ
jgi:hypothetical protein